MARTSAAEARTVVHSNARSAQNIAVYNRAWEWVNEKFYDKHFNGVDWFACGERHRSAAENAVDDEHLYAAINAMLAELRVSHCVAESPGTVGRRTTNRAPETGMRLTAAGPDRRQMVLEVAPGSPAEAAGIRPGWVGSLTPHLGAPLRVGDRVRFRFWDESNQEHDGELGIALVSFLNHRDARVLPGGYLLLRFDEFDQGSHTWLRAQLKRHRSAPGVIVDLRFNRGGINRDMMNCVNEFFAAPIEIGSGISRNGGPQKWMSGAFWWPTSWGTAHYAGDVVVMVSADTASCAEVFTYVLQSRQRAFVVGWGQRTAGAVLFAPFRPLPDGGDIQIPASNFQTTAGGFLEGVGVRADLVTDFRVEDFRSGLDTQVMASLEWLRGQRHGRNGERKSKD